MEVGLPRHGMTDAEWEFVADLFPQPAATGRPPREPRELLDAGFWIVRTALRGAMFLKNSVLGKRCTIILTDGMPLEHLTKCVSDYCHDSSIICGLGHGSNSLGKY